MASCAMATVGSSLPEDNLREDEGQVMGRHLGAVGVLQQLVQEID